MYGLELGGIIIIGYRVVPAVGFQSGLIVDDGAERLGLTVDHSLSGLRWPPCVGGWRPGEALRFVEEVGRTGESLRPVDGVLGRPGEDFRSLNSPIGCLPFPCCFGPPFYAE
jgi:hypothetical protein